MLLRSLTIDVATIAKGRMMMKQAVTRTAMMEAMMDLVLLRRVIFFMGLEYHNRPQNQRNIIPCVFKGSD